MVSSVNTNPQTQYERKFSLGKTVMGATTGAVACRALNDAMMRKNATKTISLLRSANADEFIKANNLSKEAVNAALNNADDVLKGTEYLSKVKSALKSPSTIVEKVKNWATNVNVREIPANTKKKAAGIIEGLKTKVKTLKGSTFKETLANIQKATKTLKGKQAVNLALGAVCGLLVFGTSKIVKSKEKQA